MPLTPEIQEQLANPAVSLPTFGTVLDQKSGKLHKFDPYAITHKLQATILSYASNTPANDIDQTLWLALLGYRQAGKSLTAELAGYPHAAYKPAWDHVCIADRKDRADYLHKRVHICHNNWPEDIRSKTKAVHEVRQLSFADGGMMRTLSAEQGAVGIGQSPDFFHGSELPYWADAGGQMSLIIPSMINRDHGMMVLESTPSPMDEPSAEWWRDHCDEAKRGEGRWIYAFFPFWDGKLNARPWNPSWKLDNEELNLLNKYGPLGLTLENLSFRRAVMANDKEIRRNPDLFGVYYPSDDLTCWINSGKSVIHKSVLQRHINSNLTEWGGRSDAPHYQEYEPPIADAVYAVVVDPCGWGARDHGAFHVFKCYVGEWKQVASFGGVTDPVELAEKVVSVGLRYNTARIGVERNGPGEGFLGMLIQAGYRNIHYDDAGKPGVWKHSEPEMLASLIDALRDDFVLSDKDTVAQLSTYRNDKVVQQSEKAELMASSRRAKRRDRHHWDKVSALAVAAIVCRAMPRRYKPASENQENIVLFKDMTWDQVETYRKQVNTDTNNSRPRHGRARYTRRKR